MTNLDDYSGITGIRQKLHQDKSYFHWLGNTTLRSYSAAEYVRNTGIEISLGLNIK